MKSFWAFLGSFSQVIYLFLFLITLGGFIAPYFSVKIFPFLQLWSLFILPLGLIHVVAFIFLGGKRKYLRWFSVLAILMTIWVASKEINYGVGEVSHKKQLRILSYNVENFGYNQLKEDKIIDFIKEKHPDVVCLQEFCAWNKIRVGKPTQDFAQKISEKLGLPYFIFPSGNTHLTNIAVFSKHPILKIDTLFSHKIVPNSGLLLTIDSPYGQIGVANVHFPSFNFSNIKQLNPDKLPLVAAGYDRWEEILAEQEEKAMILQYFIEHYPLPLIVTGDFNANPHSRIVTRISDRLTDSFKEKGGGVGWTFPLSYKLFYWGIRIDYQFHNQYFKTLDYVTSPITYADHYPILGIYKLEK